MSDQDERPPSSRGTQESASEPQFPIDPASNLEGLRHLDAQYTPIRDFEAWLAVPVAQNVWDAYLANFNSAREKASSERFSRLQETQLRIAAFDSGAIEGLYPTTRGITHTIAVKAALADETLQAAGESARDLFESQLDGFEQVLDWATGREPVTESGIRQLHATVSRAQVRYTVLTSIGPQETELPHGEYKRYPNHVRTPSGGYHTYAPVSETPLEMARLVEQLRSPAFTRSSPILQAAYVHHSLTTIHPFADGNGRTARALASVYTIRAASIPLVIYADQREQYFDALLDADHGNLAGFADFILDRCIDTLGSITDELEGAELEGTSLGQRLNSLSLVHGGLSLEELSAAVLRLQATIKGSVERQWSIEEFPDSLEINIVQHGGPLNAQFHNIAYHSSADGGMVSAHIKTMQPRHLEVSTSPLIGISDDPGARFAFVVVDANRPAVRPLELRLSDVYPKLSAGGQERLDIWIRKVMHIALSELEVAMRAALRDAGIVPPASE